MNNQKANQSFLFIGLIYVVVGVLGYFSIGFLGRLITNVFRVFVGEAYILLAIISVIYGLLLMLLKKELHFKRPTVFWSCLSFIMAVACWMQRGFASSSTNVLKKLVNGLYRDVQLNQVSFNSGGGFLGALVNQVLSWLHLEVLLPVASIGFVLLGVVCLLKKKEGNDSI